jgi:uncharacterized membrane protein (DUF373 family)
MTTTRSGPRRTIHEFGANWLTLSVYERFEQVIALTLTTLIAIIILIATWHLARSVFSLASRGLLTPFEPDKLQALFGQVMLLLIALEFKHSILKVVAHRSGIAQVKTVVLIALLAIARKFIILDASHYPADTILALAAVILALGITYRLVRPGDEESTPSSSA